MRFDTALVVYLWYFVTRTMMFGSIDVVESIATSA